MKFKIKILKVERSVKSFIQLISAIMIFSVFHQYGFSQSGTGDISWMKAGKYGIFMHYQYRILLGYSSGTVRLGIRPLVPDTSLMTAREWNQLVDGFDVKGFANQMAKAKMGWVMFCLDDHYFAWPCSPNSTFDYYTGYKPGEKCSHRDLILDVAAALKSKGIKLIVYYAGLNGYQMSPKILAGLSDSYRGNVGQKAAPSAETRKRRLEILKEYADKFGTKIDGWWFDGIEKDTYNGTSYDWWKINSIVHSANPKAVIAFAQGGMSNMAPVVLGIDDYSGGDTWSKQNLVKLIPQNYPPQGGILWHGKIYCGNVYHGQGDANQFSDQELITWIKTCNQQGGVCTLDWPIDPKTGLIKDFGIKQMVTIKNALK